MPQTRENSLPHFRKNKCRFFRKSTCRLQEVPKDLTDEQINEKYESEVGIIKEQATTKPL